MSAVDVLAVMDAIQRRLDASFGTHSFPEYDEARAAVAELIEAAAEMNRLAKGPTGGVSQSEKRAIVARMDAALARAGGGS